MNKKQRLFVDMDGTLSVFTPTDTFEKLYEEGYFLKQAPLAHVVSAIRRIIYVNDEIEVYILSTYLSDSDFALEEKNAWLDAHLPEIDQGHRIFVPYGSDKIAAVPGGIRKNDCLLDDYTVNLKEWQKRAKGIKLLNGINHTKGTWQGDRISCERHPADLADTIISVMQGRKCVFDSMMWDKTINDKWEDTRIQAMTSILEDKAVRDIKIQQGNPRGSWFGAILSSGNPRCYIWLSILGDEKSDVVVCSAALMLSGKMKDMVETLEIPTKKFLEYSKNFETPFQRKVSETFTNEFANLVNPMSYEFYSSAYENSLSDFYKRLRDGYDKSTDYTEHEVRLQKEQQKPKAEKENHSDFQHELTSAAAEGLAARLQQKVIEDIKQKIYPRLSDWNWLGVIASPKFAGDYIALYVTEDRKHDVIKCRATLVLDGIAEAEAKMPELSVEDFLTYAEQSRNDIFIGRVEDTKGPLEKAVSDLARRLTPEIGYSSYEMYSSADKRFIPLEDFKENLRKNGYDVIPDYSKKYIKIRYESMEETKTEELEGPRKKLGKSR